MNERTADEPAAHRRDGLIGVPGSSGDDPATRLRVRLDLAYDGTEFSGWAAQPDRRTVAGVLAEALSRVLRLPPGELGLTVAGRTDAGVHATGQVAHIDIPADRADLIDQLTRRLGGVLPPDVRLRAARPAPAGFDARFAALRRAYRYRIADDPRSADPLRRRDTAWFPRPLDGAAMHRAAQLMLGEHDFAGYCRRREGASTVRGLQRLDASRDPDGVLALDVEADAFCHSMVRSLVGALVAVGEGRRAAEWPASLLDLDRRSDAVAVAPAHGLTLRRVDYPPDGQLAARASVTRAVRAPRARSGEAGRF